MPVWIVGIEPTTWGSVQERYIEMNIVASENGLECHDFDTVFGAVLEPPVPAINGDDTTRGGGAFED